MPPRQGITELGDCISIGFRSYCGESAAAAFLAFPFCPSIPTMPPEPAKDILKHNRKGKEREPDLAERMVAFQRRTAA